MKLFEIKLKASPFALFVLWIIFVISYHSAQRLKISGLPPRFVSDLVSTLLLKQQDAVVFVVECFLFVIYFGDFLLYS